jgi:diaminopimelate epimerase
MCGNGLRCVVKYLVDNSGERPESIDVETGAGILSCTPGYGADGVAEVEISLGPARLVASNLPSGATGQPFLDAPVPGHSGLRGHAVSMGNPHLVLFDQPLEDAGRLGPQLERHPGFPERTNVEFTRVDADGGLTVVVWERGLRGGRGGGARQARPGGYLAEGQPAGRRPAHPGASGPVGRPPPGARGLRLHGRCPGSRGPVTSTAPFPPSSPSRRGWSHPRRR